jgi:phosphoglycerate dehydrogenase-like enzyme
VYRPAFAAHWSRPRLIDVPNDQPVWLPPKEAEALFTFASAWSKAPSEPPPGWPFNLRWIQLASAGVDSVPQWAYDGPIVACSRGITAKPIAEYVLHAMLNDAQRPEAVRFFTPEDAVRLRDEDLWMKMSIGVLNERTIGLLGLGAIGQEIAKRAHAFGMRVQALRRSASLSPLDFVKLVPDLNTLVSTSDTLVICAPLTPETRAIINEEVLQAANPNLHLINVARGPLIDQDALLRALNEGKIRKATLDVTAPEPLPDGHPFYSHERVVLTPHIAWFSPNHHERLTHQMLENLSRFASNERLNDVVEKQRGY